MRVGVIDPERGPLLRIANRLTVLLVTVLVVLLAADAALRLDRNLALFERDARRDHLVLGETLVRLVAETWQGQGAAAAEALLARVAGARQRVRVHLDASASPRAGDDVVQTLTTHEGFDEAALTTQVAVVVDGQRRGALVLEENLSGRRDYVRAALVQAIVSLLLLATLVALAVWGLARWLVARPFERVEARTRDATARLEEALAQRATAEEQARRADRLMTAGQLSAAMTHELGTPLNVVAARARMIVEGEAQGDEVIRYAGIIDEQVTRMSRMIRGFLDFARGQGRADEVVDLAALVEATVALLGPLAKKRAAYLVAAPTEGRPRTRGDLDLLQQALVNLVVNALHALDSGGAVTVRAWAADGQAFLEVRDDGCGISEEDLVHIYDPFFSTRGAGEGTGLGLSVVRGIVEQHGGRIEARSQVGEGSVFSLSLPLEEPT
jgi:two-component system, NtrC family, sensor kinase